MILSRPISKQIEIDGIYIGLYHGSPWNHDTYLYPDTDTDVLEKCDDPKKDFVFIGHSHYPFIYRAKNTTLVNVGSVGQSRKRGGIADWAIINTDNKTLTIQATPYSTSELKTEVMRIDPQNKYLKEILERY